MRAQNTTAVSGIVKTDLDLIIEANPESFDVVLFRANSEEKETVAEGDDLVGSLESRERRIEYEAPILAAALEPTVDIMGYPMLNSGGGYGLHQEQGPYRLLIAGRVPKQSVVAFPVAQHDGSHVVRVMYVLSAETLGRKAPAGFVYTLIPYIGGGNQTEVVTPEMKSIVDYVSGLLAEVSPPDENTTPEDAEEIEDDEIGSL